MKILIPLFLAVMALSINTQAQERTVVATVGSTPIYLDEIGGTSPSKEDEIKFVDPDINSSEVAIETQIIRLRKRIRDEIIRKEIESRAIVPPDDLVTREVNVYADHQWQLLFPNPEKKKEVLSKMKLTGLKILEGITLWKQDYNKGNEFAKKELEPLGMNEKAWAFYTENAEDPEIISKLKKWEDIDTMSQEEIKEFLFLTDNEGLRNDIRFILAKDMLKRDLVPEASVSPEEIARLNDLIYNTQWIDIIIIPEGHEDLTKLSAIDKNARLTALSEELMSEKMRLPRPGIKSAEQNNSSLKEFMIIASHTRSLEPGSISTLIEWSDQSQGLGNFVIYIVDRREKAEAGITLESNIEELKDALQKFKRDQAFLDWVNDEIPLKTKILIPEYAEVIRN